MRWRDLHTNAIALLATVALLSLAASAPAAALPPDLVGLEQQMAQLQASSERFSFQQEISLGSFLGASSPLVLIFAGDGEASDSPAQATFSGGLFGLPEEQVRVVGATTYDYRQSAGEIDGHRPWVRSERPVPEASGGASMLDPGGILGNDQTGQQGTFSELMEQLNGAQSIEESGPVTVDDQRVIEFDATLDPAPLLAQLKAQAKPSGHPLSSPLETSPVGGRKGAVKPTGPPALELEVFIAPNGLPVRARFTFADEGTTLAVRIDTLAINVPVSVQAPPAARTIDEKQLKRIERRHAARELAKALRTCRHLHGKRAKSCRALAKLKGHVHNSGSTTL